MEFNISAIEVDILKRHLDPNSGTLGEQIFLQSLLDAISQCQELDGVLILDFNA